MSDQIMKASAELDKIVPELWSSKFYPTLLENLPFNSLVARDFEGEIKALGDIVNISDFPQFGVASEMQEDGVNDADAVTVNGQQLTINYLTVKDFILSSKGQAQSLEAANKLRDLAMHAIMERMHDLIVSLIVPSASAPDHTIAFTSGSTLALADIVAGKKLLDAANIPFADRQLVTGTAQHNDLFLITGFSSRDFVPAGSPLSSGLIQSPVLGMNAVMSSKLGNVAYLFHPSFMQVAVQKEMGVEVFNLGADGKRGTRYNLTMLWGAKQCGNTRVVQIG